MPATIPTGWSNVAIKTKRGVSWWMDIDGFKEKYVPDGSNTTVLALTEFGTRGTFIEDMIGYSTVIGKGTSSPKLSRAIPEFNPWNPAQWAQNCDLVRCFTNPTPDTGRSNWLTFDFAVYQITFAAPLYKIYGDVFVQQLAADGSTTPPLYYEEHLRYCAFRTRPFTKSRMVPGGYFVIEGTNPPVPLVETSTALEKEVVITMEWLDVPLTKELDKRILEALGKVNLTAFTPTKDSDPWIPQTVLFENFEQIPRITPTGSLNYDLRFSFKRKASIVNESGAIAPVTWNQYLRADGSVVGILVRGTSRRAYQTYEFRQLFQV